MNAEASRPPTSEAWTKWEGRVVNGAFPLRRYLAGSDHSGVFLTEHTAEGLPHVALKLVPAIPTLMEAQLSYWNTAANLSHPHLIRLFEIGRCEFDNLQYLFAIMEYAEQNLGQLLLQRALDADEARQMLLPTLEALAFLHGRHLVQGQLKPSNVLVVGDQLKLAVDTVRPAGEASASINMSSLYDPPEASDGSFSAAGDIWALGVTLVEALTRSPPSWSGGRGEGPVLPADFSPLFADTVRRCLARQPADRPSVTALETWIRPEPPEPVVSVSQPTAITAPQPTASQAPERLVIRIALDSEAPPQDPPKRRSFFPVLLAVVTLLALGWIAELMFVSHSDSKPPVTSAFPASSQPVAPPSASAQSPPAPSPVPPAGSEVSQTSGVASDATPADTHPSASPAVLHEEIPNVPRSARDTIHGHVKVAVRVTVDRSGTVISDVLDNPGPSRYFARLATEAARKWKFVPVDAQATRQWLVRFEFSRNGTTGHAVMPRS
ncbi:MAG: serine/threonine protein kinase [Steroidobacteraceae bacterium]